MLINNKPIMFKGRLGKWYKDPKRPKEIEGKDTPDYTPTGIYSRVRYMRPNIWKATRVFSKSNKPKPWESILSHSGKLVAIKSSSRDHGFFALKNEADALARLQRLAWWPPFRIAPQLYEYLTFDDQESKHWFIAYEWLQYGKKGVKWESLSSIMRNRKYKALETLELITLQRTLYKATNKMHSQKVYHGDIKDEHILVKKHSENQYDFSKIRFIDFGLSYVNKKTAAWKGASLGFCNPYFWHSQNQSLNQRSLKLLDWYGIDSVLYYALTGECFPIASPAYRGLIRSNDVFQNIEDKLVTAHANRASNKVRKAFARWLIRRLSTNNPQKTLINNKFYRKNITSISGETTLGFIGLLLGLSLLLQIFQVNIWPGVAITIFTLLVFRLWKSKKFTIIEIIKREEEEEEYKWLSNQILLASVFSLLGPFILPLPFHPSIPAISALLVHHKNKNWIPGILLGFGSIVTWVRLSLSTGKFSGFSNPLKTMPISGFFILFSWLAAFWIIVNRYKIKNTIVRLSFIVIATMFVWLFPILIQRVLLIPSIFSLSFFLTGMSGLLTSLLAAFYATREYLVNDS